MGGENVKLKYKTLFKRELKQLQNNENIFRITAHMVYRYVVENPLIKDDCNKNANIYIKTRIMKILNCYNRDPQRNTGAPSGVLSLTWKYKGKMF